MADEAPAAAVQPPAAALRTLRDGLHTLRGDLQRLRADAAAMAAGGAWEEEVAACVRRLCGGGEVEAEVPEDKVPSWDDPSPRDPELQKVQAVDLADLFDPPRIAEKVWVPKKKRACDGRGKPVADKDPTSPGRRGKPSSTAQERRRGRPPPRDFKPATAPQAASPPAPADTADNAGGDTPAPLAAVASTESIGALGRGMSFRTPESAPAVPHDEAFLNKPLASVSTRTAATGSSPATTTLAHAAGQQGPYYTVAPPQVRRFHVKVQAAPITKEVQTQTTETHTPLGMASPPGARGPARRVHAVPTVRMHGGPHYVKGVPKAAPAPPQPPSLFVADTSPMREPTPPRELCTTGTNTSFVGAPGGTKPATGRHGRSLGSRRVPTPEASVASSALPPITNGGGHRAAGSFVGSLFCEGEESVVGEQDLQSPMSQLADRGSSAPPGLCESRASQALSLTTATTAARRHSVGERGQGQGAADDDADTRTAASPAISVTGENDADDVSIGGDDHGRGSIREASSSRCDATDDAASGDDDGGADVEGTPSEDTESARRLSAGPSALSLGPAANAIKTVSIGVSSATDEDDDTRGAAEGDGHVQRISVVSAGDVLTHDDSASDGGGRQPSIVVSRRGTAAAATAQLGKRSDSLPHAAAQLRVTCDAVCQTEAVASQDTKSTPAVQAQEAASVPPPPAAPAADRGMHIGCQTEETRMWQQQMTFDTERLRELMDGMYVGGGGGALRGRFHGEGGVRGGVDEFPMIHSPSVGVSAPRGVGMSPPYAHGRSMRRAVLCCPQQFYPPPRVTALLRDLEKMKMPAEGRYATMQ